MGGQRRWQRWATPAAALVAVLLTGPPAGAVSSGVGVTEFAFSLRELCICAGDVVAWVNRGDGAHTITADGSFDSGRLGRAGTYRRRYPKRGTLRYHCTLHSQMTAVVLVSPDAREAALEGEVTTPTTGGQERSVGDRTRVGDQTPPKRPALSEPGQAPTGHGAARAGARGHNDDEKPDRWAVAAFVAVFVPAIAGLAVTLRRLIVRRR